MTADARKQTYFAKATNWDEQQRERDVATARRAVRIAWAAGIVAALSVTSVITLLPLKTFVATIIRVDNNTGAYDVQAPGETLAIGQDRNQKIVIGDAGKYISAREGFTRGEAEANYRTAYFMSCGPVRAEWDQYFNPETNPNSPVKTMLPTDSDRVEIQGYTFLPTDQDDLRVLQVRYDKTLTKGVSAPVKTRYISTMTVKYDKNNIPVLQKDLHINPFGFCVVNYRRDQEGTPQILGAAAPAVPATAPAPVPAPAQMLTPSPSAAGQVPVTPANIGMPNGGAR